MTIYTSNIKAHGASGCKIQLLLSFICSTSPLLPSCSPSYTLFLLVPMYTLTVKVAGASGSEIIALLSFIYSTSSLLPCCSHTKHTVLSVPIYLSTVKLAGASDSQITVTLSFIYGTTLLLPSCSHNIHAVPNRSHLNLNIQVGRRVRLTNTSTHSFTAPPLNTVLISYHTRWCCAVALPTLRRPELPEVTP